MCLYPKTIRNKKYQPNKKNGGIVPYPPYTGKDEIGLDKYDMRVTYVQVPCGQCIECRKTKAREWQVRLGEEYKNYQYNYFVTLTFSPEGLREILFKHKIEECNAAAAYALRHSLERWRKDNKKSLRHWFITELGHEGTERIHMHGLIMSDIALQFKEIERKGDGMMAEWKYWKYGIVFVGDYVNQRSVNYVVKYMEKIDTDHKGFIGQVLCSPGIGKAYLERLALLQEKEYKDYYRLQNGIKVKKPTYYKKKELTDEEREQKWREFMDSEKETMLGITYSYKSSSQEDLQKIQNKYREVNRELGYGSDDKEWRTKKFNLTRRMLEDQETKKWKELQAKRLEEFKNRWQEALEYSEKYKNV